MFCKKCGNEVNDGAAFCPKCGAKIEIPAAMKTSTVDESVSSDNQKMNSADVSEKKHGKKTSIIIGVLGLVAVAAIALVVVFVIKPKAGSTESFVGDAKTNAGDDETNEIENTYGFHFLIPKEYEVEESHSGNIDYRINLGDNSYLHIGFEANKTGNQSNWNTPHGLVFCFVDVARDLGNIGVSKDDRLSIDEKYINITDQMTVADIPAVKAVYKDDRPDGYSGELILWGWCVNSFFGDDTGHISFVAINNSEYTSVAERIIDSVR